MTTKKVEYINKSGFQIATVTQKIDNHIIIRKSLH